MWRRLSESPTEKQASLHCLEQQQSEIVKENMLNKAAVVSWWLPHRQKRKIIMTMIMSIMIIMIIRVIMIMRVSSSTAKQQRTRQERTFWIWFAKMSTNFLMFRASGAQTSDAPYLLLLVPSRSMLTKHHHLMADSCPCCRAHEDISVVNWHLASQKIHCRWPNQLIVVHHLHTPALSRSISSLLTHSLTHPLSRFTLSLSLSY